MDVAIRYMPEPGDHEPRQDPPARAGQMRDGVRHAGEADQNIEATHPIAMAGIMSRRVAESPEPLRVGLRSRDYCGADTAVRDRGGDGVLQ